MSGVMERVSPSELISLAADDDELYCRTFFPRTFRQSSPNFHRAIWADLRDPGVRLLAMMVFRGGAKTTLLRAFCTKSLAYGISRTIVFISNSQPHARASVDWIRKLVEGVGENGPIWAHTFGLRPGPKWNEEQLDVINGLMGTTTSIIPLGITGSIRGINLDSYRPDLIVLDDVQDEENVGTPDQLAKLNALIFGSALQTLAPRTEAPNSKMVMLQTPMQQNDPICQAEKDPAWVFRRYGIFDDNEQSRWEDRFPTDEIRTQESQYKARRQWSIFAREMRCLVIPDEGRYFDTASLRYYDVQPEKMLVAMAVDPVPPPTEAQMARALRGKDWEAHVVVGVDSDKNYYVLDYETSRSHDPGWTTSTFFALSNKWRPTRCRVEGVAYQATIKWTLEQEMRRRRQYFPVELHKDPRKKMDRIRAVLAGLMADGRLYVKRSMTELVDQLSLYPGTDHDDLLDALAMAVGLLSEMTVATDTMDGFFADKIEPLTDWRTAP